MVARQQDRPRCSINDNRGPVKGSFSATGSGWLEENSGMVKPPGQALETGGVFREPLIMTGFLFVLSVFGKFLRANGK